MGTGVWTEDREQDRRRDRRRDRRTNLEGRTTKRRGGEPRAKYMDSHLKGQVLFKDAAMLTASYFNTV